MLYKLSNNVPVADSFDTDELLNIISEELNHIRAWDLIKGMPKDYSSMLRKTYRQVVSNVMKDEFEDIDLPKSAKTKLTSLVIELLRRRWSEDACYHWLSFLGVIFAGFGDKEHFPRLYELKLQSIAANHLAYYQRSEAVISIEDTGYINGFVQKDMVITFLNGIDPFLKDKMNEEVMVLASAITSEIIDAVKERNPSYEDAFEQKILSKVIELVLDAYDHWEYIIRDSHWGPIVDNISCMPLGELASIAETLVNLTKLKRRVSDQEESVGGPVDVAVISKGDGFVWVKRKPSYNSELA